MIRVSLEEAIERIEKIDNRTREERAKRLAELGTYTISLVNRPVANLMGEYLEEASFSYVNGNFRSCIFSCSAAIDQIFRHEIIQISHDYKGKRKEIDELSFGKVIGKGRKEKIPSLEAILYEAGWVNDARNRVAVHPICVTSETLDDELAKELKVEYIKNILEICDEEIKEKILKMIIKYPSEKRITLRKVIENPHSISAFELWLWDPHKRIIEPIALESYRKTVRILLHLFPVI